jgi:large subunit ribosomal protein L13
MKTFIPKEEEVVRKWFVVDAADKPAGRLACEIANVLRGKNKPTFTPHVDTGDFVIVLNAEQVKLTGRKETGKIYKHFTGYTSGLKEYSAAELRAKQPTRILERAVKGMMPKNRLGAKMYKRLKVYEGGEHPHSAQQPEAVELI